MNTVRPWFPESALFRHAREFLQHGDRSAAVASLRDTFPMASPREIDAVLRAAAVEVMA